MHVTSVGNLAAVSHLNTPSGLPFLAITVSSWAVVTYACNALTGLHNEIRKENRTPQNVTCKNIYKINTTPSN